MKANMKTNPQRMEHEMVGMAIPHAYSNGPRNLKHMIEYFKNAKVYKLQNKHISLPWFLVT